MLENECKSNPLVCLRGCGEGEEVEMWKWANLCGLGLDQGQDISERS